MSGADAGDDGDDDGDAGGGDDEGAGVDDEGGGRKAALGSEARRSTSQALGWWPGLPSGGDSRASGRRR